MELPQISRQVAQDEFRGGAYRYQSSVPLKEILYRSALSAKKICHMQKLHDRKLSGTFCKAERRFYHNHFSNVSGSRMNARHGQNKITNLLSHPSIFRALLIMRKGPRSRRFCPRTMTIG